MEPETAPREDQVDDWLGRLITALGPEMAYYEHPFIDHDDPIFVMRTRPGFIFDDYFWKVFQSFPFRICHVAYYGPARSQDDGLDAAAHPGVYELRWSTRDWDEEEGSSGG
jgi:hypothetical protein